MNPLHIRGGDPVFVRSQSTGVELRIGEARAGETRYAILSPAEARMLAYELLLSAEHVNADKKA